MVSTNGSRMEAWKACRTAKGVASNCRSSCFNLNFNPNPYLQLQELLVKLQYSCEPYIVPKELTETLDIPKDVQQDAQEFNQLLLSLLHEVLSRTKGGESSAKTLVQDQFRIDTQSSISCLGCKTTPSKRPDCRFQLEIECH